MPSRTTSSAPLLPAEDLPVWTAALSTRAFARPPSWYSSLKQLALLVPEGAKKLVSRASGWISPVLVDGGRIAGTWSSAASGGRLAVEISPFGRPRRGLKAAAEAEAARWAAFAGATAAVTWA